MIAKVKMDTSQSFSFSMDNQRLASIGAEATGPAMHHPRGASRNLPKSTPWRDDIFEQRTATRGGRKVSV